MPAWPSLIQEFNSLGDPNKRNEWLSRTLHSALKDVSRIRGGRNVIFYASAFLQKPQNGLFTQITQEDINGFMAVMHGMDWSAGLTLVLHTPGGITNSTETIVDYLRQKFSSFEVIVPTFAMSAGTMISLASEKIVMAKQSQLGPIDPQMPIGDRPVSAGSIVAQFEKAKSDIAANQRMAHLWAPILQSIGPALLEEAQNALDYSENIVMQWLESGMLQGRNNPHTEAQRIARFFNDSSEHKSHGRRIGREEAFGQGVAIENLEDDQDLQEAVLTAYHMLTILFDNSPVAKSIYSTQGSQWLKGLQQ